MKLLELIIKESTNEDRAIISLSTELYSVLKQYADTDIDYDDEDTELKRIGKIGQIVNTPLEALNDITIYIQSDYGLSQRMENEYGNKGHIDAPGGVWLGDTKSLILNSDYLSVENMKSTISHELRHALDDVKSNFMASRSPSYNTPGNKSFRKVTSDPHMGNLAYLAQPAEINARFVQVLDDMVPIMKRATQPNAKVGKNFVMQQFKLALERHNIAHLFPEKEKSSSYKRLLKRGVDFIEKEMAYLKK